MELQLQNFKPIGKAVLHRAVGLQSNYSEYKPYTLYSCKQCKVNDTKKKWEMFKNSEEYRTAEKKCEKCEYKNISDEVNQIFERKYINEKNKFGYAQRLKRNALLLYIAYHLLGPDTQGILKNISTKELAKLLNCNEKTIKANNELLVKYNYIYTSNSYDPGCINICLREYKEYFKEAKEGGRGFYTLSKELFEELKKIRSSNLLRIIVKELLELDNPKVQMMSRESDTKIQKSYHELRRFLPQYCKRSIIQKVLSIETDIFSINTSDSNVQFHLNSLYNAKKVKKELLEHNEKVLQKRLDELTEDTKLAAEKQVPNFREPAFMNQKALNYNKLVFTVAQIKDLVVLSMQYSIAHIMQALSEVYYIYICNDIPVKNLVALVRTCIENALKQNRFNSLLNSNTF